MIIWTGTNAETTRRGHADNALEAWERAVVAGLEMTAAAGGAEPVVLTVGDASARLYPAVDEDGRLDAIATREAAERILEELRDELQPRDQ